MAEENQVQQVTKEQEQVMKEPQQVTTKNPKKVEAGKRLAEHNRKKQEEQVQLEKATRWGFTQQPRPQAQPQTNKFEMD